MMLSGPHGASDYRDLANRHVWGKKPKQTTKQPKMVFLKVLGVGLLVVILVFGRSLSFGLVFFLQRAIKFGGSDGIFFFVLFFFFSKLESACRLQKKSASKHPNHRIVQIM